MLRFELGGIRMKKKILIIFSLLFVLTLTSCKNDELPNNNEVWFNEQTDLFIIAQSNSQIDTDFELPTTFGDLNIDWNSDSNLVEIQIVDGKAVAKITQSSSNKDVILTATLTYDEYTTNKRFTITILKSEDVDDGMRTIQLNVTIPNTLNDGDTLTIGSNINGWNPSNEEYRATKINDTLYQLVLKFEPSIEQTIEYKWTIQNINLENAWARVEKASDGETEVSNRKLVITSSSDLLVVVNDTVEAFADPNVVPKSTVVGNLDLITGFNVPELGDTRTIRVWTPSNYDAHNTEIRYKVIYMHDGQNLFDSTTSFAGEWEVDETIEALIASESHTGYIVVGIDNTPNRMNEYTPNWQDKPNADGDKYGEFIVNTLKPFIDYNYNTLTDANSTMIAGSSMGGLISFYLGLKYPEVFGMIGAFSSSFQVNSDIARDAFIESLDVDQDLPRIYLDAGTEESLYAYIDPVSDKLFKVGYPKELIYTRIETGHGHNEAAWRQRFPEALNWLDSETPGNYVVDEEEVTLNVYLPEKTTTYFEFLNKPEAKLYAYTGTLSNSHLLEKVTDTHYQAKFITKPNSKLVFRVLYYLAGSDGIQIFENNLDGSTLSGTTYAINGGKGTTIEHTVLSWEIRASLTVNVVAPIINIPEGETLMMGLYGGTFGNSWRDSQMTTITDTTFTYKKEISNANVSIIGGYVLFKTGASTPYFQKFERVDGKEFKVSSYTVELPTFADWDGTSSFEFTIEHIITDESINY